VARSASFINKKLVWRCWEPKTPAIDAQYDQLAVCKGLNPRIDPRGKLAAQAPVALATGLRGVFGVEAEPERIVNICQGSHFQL
jgi:hypothetical protein